MFRIGNIPYNFGISKTTLGGIKIIYSNKNYRLSTEFSELSIHDKKRDLQFPNKLTPLLAEEIGIHYGDGFLSNKKNDFRVKGHKYDEREYYDGHIKKLYKELYNLNLPLKEFSDVYGFEIYSQGLKQFKTKVLGIQAGPKGSIKFPEILKINDVSILTSFLRGLFDTDGSIIFKDRKCRKYFYPIISISIKSPYLKKEVINILKMLGLKPISYKNVAKDGIRYGVYLNGYERFFKYMKLVGFNSPKHLKKVEKWKELHPDFAKSLK